jgi:hypothetical protein
MALVLLGAWGCDDGSPVGPGARLVIVQQPSQAVVGVPLEPSLLVRLEDAAGRPTEGQISLTLDPNPCEWPVGGTTSAQTTSGVATFGNLTLGQVARGYRLTVRSDELQTLSGPIDVVEQSAPGQELLHEDTFCSKPNPQGDAETLAYIPEDDVFWLADDDSPSIFAVDRATGVYRTRLAAADFVAAFPGAGTCDDGDNDPATSCSYVNEFEHVAYDPLAGALYVMNTVNSPQVTPMKDLPAIFKLRRGGCSLCWNFETWQAMPVDAEFEGLVSIEGELFVAIGREVYRYDFEQNQALTTDADGDPLPPAFRAEARVERLHYDGVHLWVVLAGGQLKVIEWQTGTEVASYDLVGLGVSTPKGVEVVANVLYVLEGDPPNPIWLFELPAGL